MLQAERLTRRYGDFVAAADVSFVIQPGEIVGLLGHNGAGKTTIMKMLTGYLEPSSGSAWVDGIEVEQDPLAVQAQLGYLPENLPLYPELSVCDYLGFVAQLRKVDPALAVPRAIAATELEDKALDPIATLSRGYKQRVGVAQAILHEPRFLILDEPTNGLDPSQTQHMRQLIQELAGQATVILSTHIMQEVDAICDRALILRGGELVVDEHLAALKSSNELRLRCGPGNVAAAVSDLQGVSGVVPDGDAWRVTLATLTADGSPAETATATDVVAEQVAQALLAGGVALRELTPVQRDLEMVFREVNEGDQHAS